MLKYIEYKKFIRKLNYICKTYGVPKLIVEKIKKAISDSFATDVVEVVHGEWVENITYHNANSLFREYGFDVAETLLYHTCSCCNALGSNSFNYCPHCGAKMDGENNE